MAAQPKDVVTDQRIPTAQHDATEQPSERLARLRNVENWLASSLGAELIVAENTTLAKLMPQLYAPIAVQLAPAEVDTVLSAARSAVAIRIVPGISSNGAEMADGDPPTADEDNARDGADECTVVARSGVLPFAANSVDLLVMAHTLDRVEDPHQVLREISQIVAPEGHVIIVGFNPISLWGVRRLLSGWRGRFPWTARFLSLPRIKDWLRLLNFDIVSGRMCCYAPPLQNQRIRKRLAFLEKSGQRWWPGLGASYILVARKRDPGFTPVGKLTRAKKRIGVRLATPVTRRVLKLPSKHS